MAANYTKHPDADLRITFDWAVRYPDVGIVSADVVLTGPEPAPADALTLQAQTLDGGEKLHHVDVSAGAWWTRYGVSSVITTTDGRDDVQTAWVFISET